MIRFLMALRSIFRGFGPPTWGSSGGPPGVRRATFWLLKPSWIQDGPHIPPRPLQDPPRPLSDTVLKDFGASWDGFSKDFRPYWDSFLRFCP